MSICTCFQSLDLSDLCFDSSADIRTDITYILASLLALLLTVSPVNLLTYANGKTGTVSAGNWATGTRAQFNFETASKLLGNNFCFEILNNTET